jgi:type IV pilus assembly protein PilB
MSESKKRLGDLLVEAGLIDQFQLRSALSEQQKWGGRLGNHFVRLKFITEEKLIKFLSQQLKIQYVDITKIKISPSSIELIPEEIATKHNILPLGIKGEGGKKTLFIATSDPTNLEAIDEIQFLTGYTVKPILAADTAISKGIRDYYNPIPQQPLTEQAIPVENLNTISVEQSGITHNPPSKDEMVIIRDEPGAQPPPSAPMVDSELPEEAKAILNSTLGIKTILSQELTNLLMNKETRELLNILIEILITKGILKEADIKQHLK